MERPADTFDFDDCGSVMHELMRRLFPICRSISGDGVRQTLAVIAEHIPLERHEVPTGTRAFDWTVPNEWNIDDAYVMDEGGRRVIDFRRHNLHVVGYSRPIDAILSREELDRHLFSREDLPGAIPYVTSYYSDTWGFCLSHEARQRLDDGHYRVVIDSRLEPGSLTYGELLLPGQTEEEVLLSTYVCHPSMANNELSGPVVATLLARWIMAAPRRYTYRIVFVPETIGSLTYLSRHLDAMKQRTVAGFVLTCLGDDRTYSFLPSRSGETLADRAALAVLGATQPDFVRYTFRDRGSDERQYCSPGIDLPVVSVMRSKYRTYPEYHTSLDDLDLVTPAGLQGGFTALRSCLELLERNARYRTTCLGEPQLGRRGLYAPIGTADPHRSVADLLDVLAYSDGTRDLIDLVGLLAIPPSRIYQLVDTLVEEGLLARLNG
jgi:aminopeptidase-like protein